MRTWDIDRDGKVDASEAEVARGRMRRSRNDTIMNSGVDPVTGRPRTGSDAATGRAPSSDAAAAGRGRSSAADADDGLILVPGNGERPRSADASPAGDAPQAGPSRRDRESLPGSRVPAMSATIPSAVPRASTGAPPPDGRTRAPGMPSAAGRQTPPGPRDAGGTELSSRARLLPGAPPAQNPAARGPQPLGAGQDRQQQDRQQPGVRPGIIAGGVRAGAPGARPGYGAGGMPADLNAGRPSSQGPYGQRPGMGPYRGPMPQGGPAVGTPATPRPGMGQPEGGRSASRNPSTTPRVPRMTTDEFYGR